MSITPNSGTTIGGTTVTILGSNFATGAAVTIGGASATDVTVVDGTKITAVTPAHAAGAGDVVVGANGYSGSLPGGYTFVAPAQVTVAAPVISAIAVKGSKPDEPSQFADLGEAVTVSAQVSATDAPGSQLTYAWSADVGTFTGSGPSVTWTAPSQFSTPGTVTLTLKVTQQYQTTDATGLPTQGSNTVSGTSDVRVHDSVKEVSDLASDFLLAFSQQLDPNYVVRNFTTQCAGTAKELSDVENDHNNYTITSYNLGTPVTTVGFTGTCPFRSVSGDACAQVPAEWRSTIKATGQTQDVTGTDQVTAVLINDQWRLCASDWNQATGTISELPSPH